MERISPERFMAHAYPSSSESERAAVPTLRRHDGYRQFLKQMEGIGRLRFAIDAMEVDQQLGIFAGSRLADTRLALRRAWDEPDLWRLALQCEQDNGSCGDEVAARHLELFHHQRRQIVGTSAALTQRISEAQSAAVAAWREARRAKNFLLLQEPLERLLDAQREQAHELNPTRSPFDVRLDWFEPGITFTKLQHFFAPFKRDLLPLARLIQAQQNEVDPAELAARTELPLEAQRTFAAAFAKALGIDPAHHEIHLSPDCHPWASDGDPQRVRNLLRPVEGGKFFQWLPALAHEFGHALMRQRIAPGFALLPLGDVTRSFYLDESQSLLMERQVLPTRGGVQFVLPMAKRCFPRAFNHLTEDGVLDALRWVEPGAIRIHADEVTYPLHIILRAEIGEGLMNGSITVRDLPAVWAARTRELLGVDIQDDLEGPLQDIQWAYGSIGMFSAYLYALVYSARYYRAALSEVADAERHIACGDFSPLVTWLDKSIYRYGMLYSAEDLSMLVTGQGADANDFLAHLRRKYGVFA